MLQLASGITSSDGRVPQQRSAWRQVSMRASPCLVCLSLVLSRSGSDVSMMCCVWVRRLVSKGDRLPAGCSLCGGAVGFLYPF
jgi:hypothetical protein